MVPKIFN